MLRNQKILIFGAPDAPTKGGTLLLAKTLPNPLKKPWFWGGEASGGDGRVGDARNPGPPKALKSKKITKTLKLKLLVTSRSVTRTPLHACAQARWRINYSNSKLL